MGKRSNFERKERDFYRTPYEAVLPLLPHLPHETTYIEPCMGDGCLIEHLARHNNFCVAGSDIHDGVDATSYNWSHINADYFITNPPWSRPILHAVIENLVPQKGTWLLFDADWMHTKQAIPYMKWLHEIVSVGRVKWFPDSKMTGKDNCCWYHFEYNAMRTYFYGRT